MVSNLCVFVCVWIGQFFWSLVFSWHIGSFVFNMCVFIIRSGRTYVHMMRAWVRVGCVLRLFMCVSLSLSLSLCVCVCVFLLSRRQCHACWRHAFCFLWFIFCWYVYLCCCAFWFCLVSLGILFLWLGCSGSGSRCRRVYPYVFTRIALIWIDESERVSFVCPRMREGGQAPLNLSFVGAPTGSRTLQRYFVKKQIYISMSSKMNA